MFELGPVRDTYLDEKLRLTDEEILYLSPLRLPVVNKPLAIAYGTAELPPLVSDSRDLHALRAAAHAPGPLLSGGRCKPLHDHARTARCGRHVDPVLDAADYHSHLNRGGDAEQTRIAHRFAHQHQPYRRLAFPVARQADRATVKEVADRGIAQNVAC